MYCIKCGAKLESGEKICPLCETKVYHPDILIDEEKRQYPSGRMPDKKHKSKAFNGVVIIMFLIPAIVSFLADYNFDKDIEWFGYVLGALLLGYVAFALPMWFEKPNPVIFTPCVFLGSGLYLMYINFILKGDWFLTFGLPVCLGFGIVATVVVTLLYYLKKGKLYIWGSAFMALGALIMLIEYLMVITFKINFIGWSLYPLCVLVLLGGLMFYLAINESARRVMERKLFL